MEATRATLCCLGSGLLQVVVLTGFLVLLSPRCTAAFLLVMRSWCLGVGSSPQARSSEHSSESHRAHTFITAVEHVSAVGLTFRKK